MMLLVYAITGLAGGVLTGLAGLTAAMVVTPILCSVCGWSAYDAVTLSLIGALSHVGMGAQVELMPGLVVTVCCTLAAMISARFANRVEEKTLNRAAGLVLILVSVASLILS